MLFWDEQKSIAPLEKVIMRIFDYGKFEEIKYLYGKYPKQCYDFIQRYPDVQRGIKFWINKWHEKNN